MLSKKASIYTVIISSVVCSVITYAVCKSNFKNSYANKLVAQTTDNTPQAISANSASCSSVSHRMTGYKFIKPLLYGDKTCEANDFTELKAELTDSIEKMKRGGDITSASVYLKSLSNGDWFGINEEDMYHPGSLIKLPILITYLRMEELHPGVLNKQIPFNPIKGMPVQTFNSNQIQVGKSYSIKDLLTYMIAYSDNNATYLLNLNVDIEAFKKLFSDLDLPVPDVHDPNYQITAKDYSAFLKVVYNAGYLSIDNSEYAAELLSKCDFKEGMAKGLPDNVLLAHKFGEWGDKVRHQLSESGIVYLKNMPYLITIMTSGYDVKKLPNVIRGISGTSYHSLKDKEARF